MTDETKKNCEEINQKVAQKMELAAKVKELEGKIRLVNAEIARLGAPELAAGAGACW